MVGWASNHRTERTTGESVILGVRLGSDQLGPTLVSRFGLGFLGLWLADGQLGGKDSWEEPMTVLIHRNES